MVPRPTPIPEASILLETVSAILINRSRLTESSLIVHWCSQESGLFKTVARGALQPKSAFAGRLDLFVTCEVVWVRSPKTDLHTLREVHLTNPRLQLRGSYLRVLAATYFCKLVDLVAEKETPLGSLHELLKLSLDYLVDHEPSNRLIQRFESRLCSELGLGDSQEGAAALLHDVYHRPLPPQRKQLLEELAKVPKHDSLGDSDFA
ncbi:MAG: DNA repair protein RecO [Roseimicrobium sp.]